MRAELHAVMWIVALSACTYASLTIPRPDLSLPLPTNHAASAGAEPVLPATSHDRIAKPTATVDWTGRTLFRAPATAPAPEPVVVVPAPTAQPQLKGIIEENGEVKAVFAMDGGALPYLLVAPGGSIGGIEISAIGEESVTAKMPDGSVVTMKVRGAGELL